MTRPRTTALVAVAICAIGVLYTAAMALTGAVLSFGWVIQSAIHLGEMLAVVALGRAGAAGGSRTARAGLGAAALGQAVLAAAEVIWVDSPGLGEVLFGVGPILTAVGLIGAGVVIARRWQRPAWQRFAPLALGIYIVAVMTPVLIGSGGPPAPAALWALVAWDALWETIAVSALVRPARHARSPKGPGVGTVDEHVARATHGTFHPPGLG
ncbi:hypothetical protein CryarDRAFT_3213 [Cryptosporangium arvum DSM 44712]|uniref:Uncharacterized protein n=2 Tax=Cryptosporangium TaxID=65502 RepID=A0A010YPF5_9ACTN|nr:hypothetical protein CryarDRAFT_3213 [Cryptosporangium arvum DSM 44712]